MAGNRSRRSSWRGAATALAAALLCAAPAARTCLAGPEPVLAVSDGAVETFARMEFRIGLEKEYANPFDAAEVALDVEIQTPGGRRLAVPAFYCQDYEWRALGEGERKSDWYYPLGLPGWRARFAPTEAGRHTCVALLKDADGTARSNAVAFECIASQGRGFLRVSAKDPRFMEFDDGTPFFAIGQNVAFMGVSQHVRINRVGEVFGKLARNGANYVRIWTGCDDWAMGLEARKSAWARTWSWKPPFAPIPGAEGDAGLQCVKISGQGASVRCSPSHPTALRPGARYVLSGAVMGEGRPGLQVKINSADLTGAVGETPAGRWRDFRGEFTTGEGELWLSGPTFRLAGAGTVWLKDLSLKEAGGEVELLWEADPNRPVLGDYNLVDCFMLDKVVEAAEEHGIYLQLCLLTRDLYMNKLGDASSAAYETAIRHARNLLRYAVGRWGCSTNVACWEYFNEMNPGLPTGRFYSETGQYLEQIDPYGHLRATSAWGDSPNDWRHPELDLPQMHWYLRPDKEGNWKDEVEAILAKATLLRKTVPDSKPAMFGECGLATQRWGQADEMKQDEELVHFHNMLWASALSGISSTGMFWWWEELDKRDAYGHYRPLALFLADVPFTTAGLAPTSAAASDERVRVVGLQGKDCACIWLLNRQATWFKSVVGGAAPERLDGVELRLSGLADGAYRVQWWDTWRAATLKQETARASGGELHLTVPPFARDVACKIMK